MGGAFDPIHIAHLMVAEEARLAYGLDEVIFIPNNQPPLPKHSLAPANQRATMVKLAIEANPHFSLSTIEIDREGPSYSYDTIVTLRRARPEIETLYFITGADAVLSLTHWHRYAELLNLCEFIAATRPGFNLSLLDQALPSDLRLRVRCLPIPNLEISSTEIRTRISEGRSIRYLTPDPVAEYISAMRLYK